MEKMQYRALGNTGIQISRIAFGCGPVAEVMTRAEDGSQQDAIEKAIELGINWFDTARTYGDGLSEQNLGRCLQNLDVRQEVHIASKVRLMPDELQDIAGSIERSVVQSLENLNCQSLTLIQLHNAITVNRQDQPTSLAVADVLGSSGVLKTLGDLRDQGLIRHIGITGMGVTALLLEVLKGGEVETIQIPYSYVDERAVARPPQSTEDILQCCRRLGIGVLAIRAYAGGALLGCPPSPHTHNTPFFPMAEFITDRRIGGMVGQQMNPMKADEIALRFVLSEPAIEAVLIGFGEPDFIQRAHDCMLLGGLSSSEREIIRKTVNSAREQSDDDGDADDQ